MKLKGRPRQTPIQLQNGFYIEVCNKGNTKGVKIKCANYEAMKEAGNRYSRGKDVILLGEYRNGEPVSEPVTI